jgi:predicted RNase H-like nuclease (RuvC/YqgF family)
MTNRAQASSGRTRRRLVAFRKKTLPVSEARVNELRRRVAELEREMQESRRLNRRLAELTDVVQELLVPLAQQDQARFQTLLKKYSDAL